MDADKEIVVDVARTVLLLLNYRSFLQVVCRPPAIAIALLSCLFFWKFMARRYTRYLVVPGKMTREEDGVQEQQTTATAIT